MTELEFIDAIEACETQAQLDKICRDNILVWFENEDLNRRIFNVRCRILDKKPLS